MEIPEELLNEYVIGIDLGTTNTCVAIWRNGSAEIIPDEYGNRTIPSYVAYTNKNRYIGNDAKKQKDLNTKNTFYEVKRLIGRKITDKFVIKEKEFLPYDIIGDENDNILLKPDIRDGKCFTPEEISAAVLTKAKQMASDYLKCKITKCVITIPAHFNDGQRQATKDASKIAGLECIRIINEPTAAALAYGLLERTKTSNCNLKTILVYDFGGGTLDVSLLTIENGIFDVIGTTGNMKLGGSDFDNCLIDFCLKKFAYHHKNFNLKELSAQSLQKLRISCEQAKQLLSTVTETHIAVKEFYEDIDLCYKITRVQFEELCSSLFMMCLKPVNDILNQSEMTYDQIDEIILVGGMTRVPKIRELLKMKFKKDPNCTINPDEAVAAGASIQAHLLSHLDDPFSEAITLLDSTALSLGVETLGGIMDVVIPRGETIPTNSKQIYSTDEDYVKSVKIKVYEGERTLTKDNFLVGEFELCGLVPQPRGLPEIEVTFNIDANNIITVTATNKKTNDTASMMVTSNKGRLSQDKINEMIEEARELEIKDEFEKRKKCAYYEIDDLCSNILNNVNSKVSQMSEKDKELIRNDITKILEWLKEKSYDEREENEYDVVANMIKKKYTILIIKCNNDTDNIVQSQTANITTTSIYDDEEDEKNTNQVFAKLENDQMGFNGLSDPDKNELKELKKSTSDLCYSLIDVISSSNINMEKNHIDELKDYIEDTLLWIHVHEKITKNEYIEKINEINKNCDRVFNYYNEKQSEIFKPNNNTSKKEELENLCFALKITIDENMLHNCIELKNYIEETIKWIYESEINDENEYNTRIEIINSMSSTVLENIQQNPIIDTTFNNDQEDECEETEGTSIIALMQQNKNTVIEQMIMDDE
jgi:heat shock protein 1/8